MVRPNGSTIGWSRGSDEVKEEPLITCLAGFGAGLARDVAECNLGTFQVGYNREAAEAGRDQRAAGCVAAGAAAGAGAAAAFGGFGFFGRIGLRDFGGGAAGWSSANTGLGSMMVVGGEVKSPGLRITWTGTVIGWNLGLAKVTEKPASGAGTSIEQGVLQPGPSDVVASAPAGTDSSATFTSGGVDLKESSDNDEQPARLAAATAIAMTRRMTNHSVLHAAIRHKGEP